MNKYLTIDIGGTFIKYAIMDEECNFYQRGKVSSTTVKSKDDLLKLIAELFEHNKSAELKGLAISAAGPINSETGYMLNGGALYFIQDCYIAKELEDLLKVHVTIENDGKAAGLAEVWKGSLKDCNNSVALIIGTGLGGAVIVDRKVLRGAHLMAGEFSFLFEDYLPGLEKYPVLGLTGSTRGLISEVSKETGIPESELDGKLVFDKANAGDSKVLTGLHRFCRKIAAIILNLQYITDPERFAIGGGISIQPLLIKTIQEELDDLCALYPLNLVKPEITTCKFFNDSNLIGALYVHLKSLNKIQ